MKGAYLFFSSQVGPFVIIRQWFERAKVFFFLFPIFSPRKQKRVFYCTHTHKHRNTHTHIIFLWTVCVPHYPPHSAQRCTLNSFRRKCGGWNRRQGSCRQILFTCKRRFCSFRFTTNRSLSFFFHSNNLSITPCHFHSMPRIVVFITLLFLLCIMYCYCH